MNRITIPWPMSLSQTSRRRNPPRHSPVPLALATHYTERIIIIAAQEQACNLRRYSFDHQTRTQQRTKYPTFNGQQCLGDLEVGIFKITSSLPFRLCSHSESQLSDIIHPLWRIVVVVGISASSHSNSPPPQLSQFCIMCLHDDKVLQCKLYNDN